MKSMCKYWGLYISMDTDCLEVVLGSFWAVWRGLLMSLEPKLRSWQFSRYWRFNKQYYGGYQLICLISWPILIALGFLQPLRPWESSKNWWRYGQMKFVTNIILREPKRKTMESWHLPPSQGLKSCLMALFSVLSEVVGLLRRLKLYTLLGQETRCSSRSNNLLQSSRPEKPS